MLSNLFREAIIITNMTRALRQKERTKLYHLKKKKDVKLLNKKISKSIPSIGKKIPPQDQLGFMPGVQGCFNI